MKKWSKAIKAFYEILRNPWLLNHVLSDDTVWRKYLIRNYGLSGGLPVVDLRTLCPNLSESLEGLAFLGGSSLPTDLALLTSLSRQFEHCRYFEIGTWRGESVRNVARYANECYTLNLSKTEIMAEGLGERYADLHGFFSRGIRNIHHLTGNSMNFDFGGLQKSFDLVFIDGSHHHAYVKNDTEKVFKHLIHERSIVVWHDYARSPEHLRPEVMAAILDGTPPEFRRYLYHVSNTLCAVFIRENLPTMEFRTPIIPDKVFSLDLHCKDWPT